VHANAQIEVNPKAIHYGTLVKGSNRVVDLYIENKTNTKQAILRATFSHEFETLYTAREMGPGGSMGIRIKINPRLKGKFEENVELWYSGMNTPVIVPITAEVLYVNVNEDKPCPTFGQEPAECCPSNAFIVEVLNAKTDKPIQGATIKLMEKGVTQKKWTTPANGMVSQEVPIGFYTLEATCSGFKKDEVTSYINKQHNRFTLRLEPLNDESVEPLLPQPEPEPVVQTQDSLISIVPVVESTVLPESQFNANNIVFLLDISGSMGTDNRLLLMQTALRSMSSAVRPVDQVALISYANEAKLLLPSTTGDHKLDIENTISTLEAKGITAGAIAFKRAYKEIKKHRLESGNNQLVVITDGVFKPSDQVEIEKLVKKASRKGIKTSVVAIDSNGLAMQKLILVSELGNGSFLPVQNEQDATHVLVEEIKKQSAK
jgi:Ca-activated chloride channel family protein